jgi:homoaconitase
MLFMEQVRFVGLTAMQKQGVLPLWFADKADYSRIGSGDMVETIGLADLIQGRENAVVMLKVTKRTGEVFVIPTKHTMSEDQLKWFSAGSALNFIRSQMS